MRYRTQRQSTAPRTITVKFAGKCACCGATIPAGTIADYYPARREIAHLGGLDGTSSRCTSEIRQRADFVRDPSEDTADRWQESHGDRF